MSIIILLEQNMSPVLRIGNGPAREIGLARAEAQLKSASESNDHALSKLGRATQRMDVCYFDIQSPAFYAGLFLFVIAKMKD
jgi:hypothetical protein